MIAPSSIGATPYYVGAATITLDSIGATTTALDYSRFYRVRGLITPTLVGAALDTTTFVGATYAELPVLSGPKSTPSFVGATYVCINMCV